MSSGEVVTILQRALWVTLAVGGPIVAATLVVGLLVSILQAATQVNEATLTFVPKLIVVAVILLLFGPGMLETLELLERKFADAFDAVFSTAALHWIPDHGAVFASVYRALAPAGRFVAQCGGAGNLTVLLGRAAGLLRTPPYDRYAPLFSQSWHFPDVPATMLGLERAGFTAIDVALEEAPTVIPERDGFAEFVATICLRPHLAVLPPDLRSPFVGAIVEQSAADPEPFLLDFCRLNLYARKPAAAEQAA